MARNYKKEYAARKEYLKAYRRKNKDKDASRTAARRKLKCGKPVRRLITRILILRTITGLTLSV